MAFHIKCGKKDEQGNRHFKKLMRRMNRHRAKQDPECQPTYNRFCGWTH